MKKSTVNFEALKGLHSFTDILKTISKKRVILMLFVFLGGIFVSAITGEFIYIFAGLIYALIEISSASSKHMERVWRKFASNNGWHIGLATDPTIVPPAIAEIGHSRKLSDVITGRLPEGNELFRLFTYSYSTGSGKHRVTHNFTLFQIILDKQFPSLFLDSKRSSAAKRTLKEYQHISLEGDFDNYFNLYAPIQNRVDVLSIITPDIMHVLMSNNSMQDIEILGNQLWFMSTDDKRGIESLPQLFASLSKILAEFKHKTRTYHPTLVHNPDTITISDQTFRHVGGLGPNNVNNLLFSLALALVIFTILLLYALSSTS